MKEKYAPSHRMRHNFRTYPVSVFSHPLKVKIDVTSCMQRSSCHQAIICCINVRALRLTTYTNTQASISVLINGRTFSATFQKMLHSQTHFIIIFTLQVMQASVRYFELNRTTMLPTYRSRLLSDGCAMNMGHCDVLPIVTVIIMTRCHHQQ